MSSKKSIPSREQRICPIREGLALLFSRPENKRQRFLAALWQNWRMIMGDALAEIALPLGHKKDILIVGAEDNMAMQEISLQTPEIIERANAFMDCEFFSGVKVTLLLGQRSLTWKKPAPPVTPLRASVPPRPPRLGGLRGTLHDGSIVAECYAAYVAMYEKSGGA